MTAFESISMAIREKCIHSLDTETIKSLEDIICIILSRYDIKEKEESVIVYDSSDQTTLSKFFLSKAVQGCTEKTLETYKTILLRFFRHTNRHIKEVNSDDIRIYLAQAKINKASDAYLLTIYRTLSSFFYWCTSEEIISKNPINKVDKIKLHQKIEAALTEEEMESLRYACKTKREKAFIEFLYSTGCRVSEACALNRNEIDFEKMEATVLGKGKKYRTVYLTQRAKFALMDYLDSRKDIYDALFTWDLEGLKGGLRTVTECDNPRLQPDEARSIVRKIGKRVGLKVHPHLIRKTVATQALKRGMPIDQVKIMLGHANINTTQIYAQTDTQQVKIAHNRYV